MPRRGPSPVDSHRHLCRSCPDVRSALLESYIVIDPGDVTGLKERELVTDERYRELVSVTNPGQFVAKMGAEAIKELLAAWYRLLSCASSCARR